MINALEAYIAHHNYDPIWTMNTLRDAGIISDNAVFPKDVALVDAVRAVEFLKSK